MSKTAHELTRKEMKGPDRFQVAASEAAHWMANRQKQLAIVAVGVLAVAVFAVAISSWIDSRGTRAGGLLYSAIDAASGEVSSIPLPNFDHPIYKTEDEKARAVLAAADRVRQAAGGTRAATTALLLEGDAQLALHDWDKAIAAYNGYLSAAPSDDSLRFGALDGLARAQEGKGDLDAAAQTYEKASGIGFFKDRANLERARVLAKAGKAEEARKIVESVAKDSQEPSLQAEAQERLTRLGGK